MGHRVTALFKGPQALASSNLEVFLHLGARFCFEIWGFGLRFKIVQARPLIENRLKLFTP